MEGVFEEGPSKTEVQEVQVQAEDNGEASRKERSRKRDKKALVLAESFLALASLLVLSGLPTWVACQPARHVTPSQRAHWEEINPDLLIMHTEPADLQMWNPGIARKIHARTGEMIQIQEASREQIERGGLLAVVHKATEGTHGILRALMSALGHLRWHVWQVVVSPELQPPLAEKLSEIGSPAELSDMQALEVICRDLTSVAAWHLGVGETTQEHDAYPAELEGEHDEEGSALPDAFAEPPQPQDVPVGFDMEEVLPADLDGLEVEPDYDSLEELPEGDREQLVRLANTGVRKAVRRAHAALGHPHRRVLIRMLQLSGASRPAIEYARLWECPACQERAMPQKARPATSTFRPTSFNAAVHVDIKYVRTIDHKLWIFLSMVDAASGFHHACLLKTRESGYVANKFIRHWIGVYGVPDVVHLDQGGEFMGAFMGVMEAFAIPTRVAGSAAAWQHGIAERHGAVLSWILAALLHEQGINTAGDLKTALAASCAAKNTQVRRAGYSPEQMVFGRSMAWMSDLADLGVENPKLPQHTLDGDVWKATVMRAQASQAFARLAVSSRMRRLMLRNIPVQREYWPGQLVYFYTEARRRSRHVPDGKRWRGPATVLAREGERRYYVSWRTRLLLCAGEQLRPASVRETRLNQILTESTLRDSLAPSRTAQAIDVRPAPQAEEPDDVPVPPSIEVILPTRILPEQGSPERQRTTMRRPLPEVTRTGMLRRLRARRMVQQTVVPLAPVKRRREAQTEETTEMERRQDTGEPELQRPRIQSASGRALYLPEEIHDQDDETFWREVGHLEDQYAQEEPAQRPSSSSWQDDFTDVPLQFRQLMHTAGMATEPPAEGLYVEAGDVWKHPAEKLEKKIREDPNLQEVLNTLISTVNNGVDKEGSKDKWADRNEVRLLRKLVQFPLTCVRIHGVPRKQLAAGLKEDHICISMCRAVQPKAGPSWTVRIHGHGKNGKLKVAWQGVTGFFKQSKADNPIYVQVPNGALARVKLDGGTQHVAQAFAEWAEHSTYVLAMKPSGKELDPTKFNKEESDAFEESDRTEWTSWIKNGVVSIVPSHEVHSIPRSRIFPVPARMIRVNKDKDGGLFAKSRMVIPGHLDPALGESRSDAPTVSPEVMCMLMSVATCRRWGVVTFDVTTAFLQGNPTEREIYIRTPKQILPALPEHQLPAIPPCTLLRVLKSAYGLSEAPRLWYLRAHEALLQAGFEEVAAAPCCYRWVEEKEVVALLSLHVDDGMVIADLKSSRWRRIQDSVDKAFKIKEWIEVTEKAQEHLGLQLKRVPDGYEMDMKHYVLQKIGEIPTRRKKGVTDEQVLDDKEKQEFRSLLAKVTWPARKVGLAFAYRCSRLASSSNHATQKDLLALWTLAREMKEAASQDKMKLCYRRGKQQGGIQLVACHDASFGREPGGKSQAGYIIGLAATDIEHQESPFHVVTYSTHRIKRVVKSTMAAESAAVAEAADMMQYLLVLYRQMTEGDWRPGQDWQSALAGYEYPGVLVTDGKSLFDHLSTTGNVPSEKQVLLDLLYVKEQVEQGRLRIKWVPGTHQLSDVLTKDMKATPVLEKFLQSGCYALVQGEDEQKEEERQQGLRREQRQRYKARKKIAAEEFDQQSKNTFTPV
eukprot:6492198-Amphidinium_carterae.1